MLMCHYAYVSKKLCLVLNIFKQLFLVSYLVLCLKGLKSIFYKYHDYECINNIYQIFGVF